MPSIGCRMPVMAFSSCSSLVFGKAGHYVRQATPAFVSDERCGRWCSCPVLLAQPRLDQSTSNVATGFLAGGQRPSVMVAADALVAFVGCADSRVDVADH